MKLVPTVQAETTQLLFDYCGGLACQKLAVAALIRYVTYSVSESEKALCGHNRPKKGHTYTDLSQDYVLNRPSSTYLRPPFIY